MFLSTCVTKFPLSALLSISFAEHYEEYVVHSMPGKRYIQGSSWKKKSKKNRFLMISGGEKVLVIFNFEIWWFLATTGWYPCSNGWHKFYKWNKSFCMLESEWKIRVWGPISTDDFANTCPSPFTTAFGLNSEWLLVSKDLYLKFQTRSCLYIAYAN